MKTKIATKGNEYLPVAWEYREIIEEQILKKTGVKYSILRMITQSVKRREPYSK
ncbi:hypothetical protein [Sphingobacterium sp. xlx-130]|uniref:hypothetical protein n=1 Tax=Sphingobacterium sp. xlx-130 TaxID=2654323 RepID=UPI001F08A0FD|nr:hypothetical protein [Sphingobacterium sp. xlx-130]